MADFSKKSYELQRDLIIERVETNAYPLEPLHDKSLAYYYTHTQMMENLDPLITSDSTWVTLGDMWGREAAYIIDKGGQCIATDLSDSWLIKAKELGYINSYQIENAESLTFADESIDYSVLKDVYHHCPRPYMAVYEMIRVSKKAVVIVEAVDQVLKMPLLLMLYNVLDRFNTSWGQKVHKNRYSFEFVGNFVYKISEREVEKLALGINLPIVAFKPFNKIEAKDAYSAKEIGTMKLKRKIRNFISFLGILPTTHISSVIFKEQPSEELMNKMKAEGYRFTSFMKNPYV